MEGGIAGKVCMGRKWETIGRQCGFCAKHLQNAISAGEYVNPE